jgi:two-component system alkaline phosphatase synthesis response regulator PhoP
MKQTVVSPLSRHILFFGEKNTEQQKISEHLEMENFVVHHVTQINDALANLNNPRTEIILMDTSGNEMACLELCHMIKSGTRSRKNLVILTSDCNDESSEVAAFRAGADDYIPKPLKPLALVERLRTRTNEPKNILTIQSEQNHLSTISIDRESYTVFSDNKVLSLTRKEFELLYLLASQPGRIFRRREIFEAVWKKKFDESNRTVDVHILRLRKKMGEDSIQTQKGVGYRFSI